MIRSYWACFDYDSLLSKNLPVEVIRSEKRFGYLRLGKKEKKKCQWKLSEVKIIFTSDIFDWGKKRAGFG